MPRKLILGLALAWCLQAFLSELSLGLGGYDTRREHQMTPAFWRFGTAPVRQLEQCLADVRANVPPGSFVAFTSPSGAGQADFFRLRWVAYRLPEMEVIPLYSPSAAQYAQYLIDYRTGFRHQLLEPMRPVRNCKLYRVRRP
ncbi:MAG TPA: hypothetical protein VMW27_02220 [Thermoanaerobaculia bacterium]|nr:hypothetical protein [Thermoanaerobaculia bacterium]